LNFKGIRYTWHLDNRVRGALAIYSHNIINKECTLNNWYENITKGQKIFIYFTSVALIMLFGIGLIPLAILIYLELGERGRVKKK